MLREKYYQVSSLNVDKIEGDPSNARTSPREIKLGLILAKACGSGTWPLVSNFVSHATTIKTVVAARKIK